MPVQAHNFAGAATLVDTTVCQIHGTSAISPPPPLQNNVVSLDDVRMPGDALLQARGALLPFDVLGDRQYYLSLRFGHSLRPDMLRAVLVRS